LNSSIAIKTLKLIVSVGLFALAVYLLDWRGVVDAMSRLSPWTFVLAVLIIMLEFPLYALRWHMLVQDITPLSFRANTRRYFLAVFFNNFTPAQIGGDVYRFFSLRAHSDNKLALVSRLIQERLLGLIGILCFFLLCLTWAMANDRFPEHTEIGFIYIGGLIFTSLIGLSVMPQVLKVLAGTTLVTNWKLASQCVDLGRQALDFKTAHRFGVLLLFSFLSAFGWTFAILIIAWDVGSNISFSVLGLLSTAVEIIRLIPVTVQGIGVREPTFAYFFEILGFRAEQGFVIGTFAYLALSIATVLAGVLGRVIADDPVVADDAN